jgi:hypothetical protein
MVEFAQSVPNLTESSTNLYELVKGRNITVYSDDEIRLAMSRAAALETSRGWRIAKEKLAARFLVLSLQEVKSDPIPQLFWRSIPGWPPVSQVHLVLRQVFRAFPHKSFWDRP